ncbi:MAG: N-6 DNA methylase [Sulfuricurvum sp.]|nr:N-6 DNA methylase [Sulfuricurvum sp.]MDD5387557.1 N-6 DNA methylase [Sulfuricurvum sp.]
MKKDYLKKLIINLGFKPEEAKEEIYIKSYKKHNGYILRVDFNEEAIEYGEKITVGDKTTSNFSSSENFVVLECVDKLLDKGYAPEKMTLEIKWDLGRKEKGKLDIYVADKDDDNKCFLMIECKTFGSEYDKERKNMLAKGGQLFSYFQQDKSAQYLCLYASRLNDNGLDYLNSIVEITEDIRVASNKNETHSLWNKSFKDNGIFEDWADIYDIKSKALIREKLRPLQQSDSGFIFNRFAEILRHNVVSDKPNAFNKMFNLFLCKIEDENRDPDEELSFQWKEDDTHITLQNRLNNLYKEGMRKFLNIDITDFSDNDLDRELMSLNSVSKQHISDMFMKLRLYKNNEFAFKEVFDDASFEENANVVKEVVELLQPFQLRYSHKQQFLGDFFELLLNTGLKQESGQFFTPVPIAKFITSSIPLKEIIEKKLENREEDFLPYVIDYAAGSGHFLTEAMDEIQHIIEAMDKSKYKDSVRRKLNSYSEDTYAWAKDFVYGIEKDYRLVKTAKVACFLNGDGLANLAHADGLDSFENSADYEKLLKKTADGDKRNNHQFDVIVANPPYSVSAFKNTLKKGKESFSLYNRLTDDSSEIECLFIERTKQLLKEGGVAGIILPSSILSNTGIYTDAREIILKYFDIVGVAELGSNTFMATGTNTVTLFLKKRDENHWVRVKEVINKFMSNPMAQADMTCNGIAGAFSTYCESIYQGLDFNDYKALLSGTIIKDIELTEMFIDYKNLFKKSSDYKNLITQKQFLGYSKEEQQEIINNKLTQFIRDREGEKVLYFILSYNQQVILIKSGEKQVEKEFLGYEFSARRGHEGMRMYFDKQEKPTTKLYDMENLLNDEKVNSYVHRAFLGETISEKTIHKSVEDHVFIKKLHEMIAFDKVDFLKEVSLVAKKKVIINSKWELKTLGELVEIEYGTRIVKKNEQGVIYPVYGGGGETFKANSFNRENRFIISRFGMSPQCVRYVSGAFFLNDSGFTVKSNTDLLNIDYLNLYLYQNQENIYSCGRGVAQKNIDIDSFKLLNIPLPPFDIQKTIVKELENNDLAIKVFNSKINLISQEIDKSFLLASEFGTLTKLGQINTMLKRGKSTKYGNSTIQVIKSGQARGYEVFDFSEEHFAIESFKSDERNLQKGDILINSSGVGTAGRVTIFNLEGDFVADSHISILRLNQSIALPRYVLYALADIGFQTIEKMAKGQSGQIELTIPTIESIKIPLPSLDKQREIVEKIETLEKEKDDLAIKISTLKDQESKILQSYL